MSKHAQFEVSQGAVIQNEKGHVLILKLHNKGWVLPGGHLHANENWLDGLRREIQEETGITDFEINGVVAISTFGTAYGVCFHAMVPSSTPIILSEEHDEYSWVSSKEELDKYAFYHPILKDCALKVLEMIEKKESP